MAPCMGNDRSRVFARASLRAACGIAILGVAVLSGCAEPNPNEICEGRGGLLVPSANNEPWDSEAQRRAAVAIECDAQEILHRVLTAGISETDVTALRNRESELVQSARQAVRAGAVESSRLPLSLAHQQMYEVAAEAERIAGSPAFLAWVTNPWKPLAPLERSLGVGIGTLSIALMPGERRALALNVRSSSAVSSRVRIWVNVSGFRADAIEIYQINWTGDDRSNWAAAELEPLGDASAVREASVLPGVTRQIWFEVHPDIAAVPGQYTGNVSLSTDDGQTADVPIAIKVFATRFTGPSLHFGGWDYSLSYDYHPNYAVRETNRAQYVEYLQERYVDTPWEGHNNRILYRVSADANGRAAAPLDASALEAWLSQWPNGRRFRVDLKVGDHIAGIPATDARFSGAVATWALAWAAQIRRLNKSPEQFDLLIVDEPQTAEQMRLSEIWATAIRQSGAGFRIWTDLVWQDPLALPDGLLDAVDTVAVNLDFAELQEPQTHDLWARTLSDRGKTLEVYAFGGPARRLDPYAYYRLIPWRAFLMGASGVTFWSFADTGGSSSDNEFAVNEVDYSPLFIGHDVVRPGKHMEAAAEGIQDAYYLELLKQVASTYADEGVRRQAQQLFGQAAAFIYQGPKSANAQWRSQHEAEAADSHRVRIAEFLDSLPR